MSRSEVSATAEKSGMRGVNEAVNDTVSGGRTGAFARLRTWGGEPVSGDGPFVGMTRVFESLFPEGPSPDEWCFDLLVHYCGLWINTCTLGAFYIQIDQSKRAHWFRALD